MRRLVSYCVSESMTTTMESDTSDTSVCEGEEDSGDEGAIYCCMHISDTKSKLATLTDKSYAKFRECSNRWRELDCPESLVAAAFFDQHGEFQHSQSQSHSHQQVSHSLDLVMPSSSVRQSLSQLNGVEEVKEGGPIL